MVERLVGQTVGKRAVKMAVTKDVQPAATTVEPMVDETVHA